MILRLERDFHLGLGGFRGLAREDQARLLAFSRVEHDPEGEAYRQKHMTTKDKLGRIFAASTNR